MSTDLSKQMQDALNPNPNKLREKYLDAQKTETFEHFFIDEDFYSDLEDFMHDRQLENKEEIEELKDDWAEKIEYAQLEKVIEMGDRFIDEISELLYDSNEERFPETDGAFNKIKEALKQCIDMEKLNKMMPELWYPQIPHQMGVITKKDLLDAL